ncbi:MAG: hypothetical protein JST00_02435, partial [Deltaproteobacteria bacterium]|nr:hypothetical protein [Deltaproteobacteria bacterium]
KLLDFGIAKLAGEGEALTSVGAVLGTPAFMAPEQIGNVAIDARTDLYAVGATMYYALTGRKPHEASSLTALLYAIAHEQPPPLESLAPHVDRALVAVIARAMQKDPGARFSSAREMRAALEPWAPSGREAAIVTSPYQVSTTIQVPPPGGPTLGAVALPQTTLPMPPPQPARSSSSTLAIVGGMAALVVLVGGGVIGTMFYLHGQAPAGAVATASAAAPAAPSATPSATVASKGQPATATPGGTTQPAAAGRPATPGSAPPTPNGGDPPGAPAAPSRAQTKMSGTTAHFSSGRYSGTTSKESRPVIDAAMPRLSACHASTELDPPVHEFPTFLITIAPTGAVMSVQRTLTSGESPHPKYDACARAVLSSLTFPATPKGATITLGISSPIPR